MELNKKLEKFILYSIEIIFILIITFLTIESIFKTCLILPGEITNYLNDNPIIHIITILITISIFTILNNKKIKVSKKLVYIFIGIWLFISFFWIFMADLYPREDQRFVYEIAEHMRKGNFESFERGKYAFVNPHQSGLILYEYFLGFIFQDKNYIALQLINVIALLVSFICIYKITKIIFKNNNTSVLSILGLLLFIPIWFYITFIYGNILGLMFSMIATLFILKYLYNRNLKYVILSTITINLAIIFKSNYLISLIAIICILLVDIISNKKWKNFIWIFIMLFIYFIIHSTIPIIMHNITGKEQSLGAPMIGYIEMGLQEGKREPGWYNRYNKVVYKENDYDYENTKRIIKNDISNSLNTFKNNPKYACEFFYRKAVSQWNNPTFQAFWINWHERKNGSKSPILKITCINNPINKGISIYMNIVQTLILFGTLLFMIINFKNTNYTQLVFAIIFIGGFMFHIIWEAKCQYTLTYFVLLIPYSIKGYINLANILNRKMKTKKELKNNI